MIEETPSSGEVLAALLERVYMLNRVASTRKPGGYTPSSYRVLGLLSDHGPQRIGDLADDVHMSQPGMTKTVNLLVDQGLATRSRDPDDSRVSLVTVTDPGRELIRKRAEEIVGWLLEGAAPLSESERRTLQETVRILESRTPGASTPPEKDG